MPKSMFITSTGRSISALGLVVPKRYEQVLNLVFDKDRFDLRIDFEIRKQQDPAMRGRRDG